MWKTLKLNLQQCTFERIKFSISLRCLQNFNVSICKNKNKSIVSIKIGEMCNKSDFIVYTYSICGFNSLSTDFLCQNDEDRRATIAIYRYRHTF